MIAIFKTDKGTLIVPMETTTKGQLLEMLKDKTVLDVLYK